MLFTFLLDFVYILNLRARYMQSFFLFRQNITPGFTQGFITLFAFSVIIQLNFSLDFIMVVNETRKLLDFGNFLNLRVGICKIANANWFLILKVNVLMSVKYASRFYRFCWNESKKTVRKTIGMRFTHKQDLQREITQVIRIDDLTNVCWKENTEETIRRSDDTFITIINNWFLFSLTNVDEP